MTAPTLDQRIVRECVTAWVATYQWITRDDSQKEAGHPAKCPVDTVDQILGRHGIYFQATRHRSLYREYEQAVVRLAYKRMGIERPVEPVRLARGRGRLTPQQLSERAADKARVVAMFYDQGMTRKQIARETGVGYHEVARYVRETEWQPDERRSA